MARNLAGLSRQSVEAIVPHVPEDGSDAVVYLCANGADARAGIGVGAAGFIIDVSAPPFPPSQ